MLALPVIAIFDVGKTNKKLFLFDQDYNIVFERSSRFPEIMDEDGYPCEDLASLRASVFDQLNEVLSKTEFTIKALNFSTYGASFVHIDEAGMPVTQLYNYLKPYPEELKRKFYDSYGGEEAFSYTTASPVLGNLNSGMQLYWLKYARPQLYNNIRFSLHLPQYMSYLFSGHVCADITSIGCHTNLWNFQLSGYHEWVYQEGIINKLPLLVSAETVRNPADAAAGYRVGIGLHDSSAALIPYLMNIREPFVLLSTGTWCISLNPFNPHPLTPEELHCDCLCYLTYQGQAVKASRLFAGNEHEQQVNRIAAHFNHDPARYRTIQFNPDIMASLEEKNPAGPPVADTKAVIQGSIFGKRELSAFSDDVEAYYQLIADIVTQQYASTSLVLTNSPVKKIFVDGGFSANSIYMHLLAAAFPQLEVFAASVAQSTAVGTALAIHGSWNSKPLPGNLIMLRRYANRYKEML